MANRSLLLGLLAGVKAAEGGINQYYKTKDLRLKLAKDKREEEASKRELDYKERDSKSKERGVNADFAAKTGMSYDEYQAGENAFLKGYSKDNPAPDASSRQSMSDVSAFRERLKTEHASKKTEHQDYEIDDINSAIKSLETIQGNGVQLTEQQSGELDQLKQARHKRNPNFPYVPTKAPAPAAPVEKPWHGVVEKIKSGVSSAAHGVATGMAGEKVIVEDPKTGKKMSLSKADADIAVSRGGRIIK